MKGCDKNQGQEKTTADFKKLVSTYPEEEWRTIHDILENSDEREKEREEKTDIKCEVLYDMKPQAWNSVIADGDCVWELPHGRTSYNDGYKQFL